MTLLTHIFKQVATIITVTTDGYGDQIPSIGESIMCRFRYFTEVDNNSHMEGVEASDAIIWVEPTANVSEGSIILVDGSYWRINRLVKARRINDNTIQFLKGFVKKHELAGDFS